MPQLMPLNWLMSVYMLGFVFLMVIKIYNMLNNKVMRLNKNFYNNNNNLIWLW